MSSELAKDRAIRLFTFLRQLSELRTKTIRTLDNYEQVIWLSEIPQEKGCFFYAWEAMTEINKDIWIEVSKPILVPVPPVSKELQPWIIEKQLANSSLERPEISTTRVVEQIIDSGKEGEEDAQEILIISLEENPEIKKNWETYIKNQWIPWAVENQKLKQIQKVFSDLYAIYQYQQRMAESYEVVLSMGFLTCKNSSGQVVRRHILTAQTHISFEPKLGKITVGASAEGANITLEQDMLEPSERPDLNEIHLIEKLIENLDEDITNKFAIDTILRSWINTVPNSLGYDDQIKVHKIVDDAPKITFAPSLILRSRTERSLVRAFKEIIEHIKGTERVPSGLDNLVNDPDKEESRPDDELYSEKIVSNTLTDNEIYFPLLANDEQINIARQLQNKQGVLVQGPPGTGKSHTIANLICHLLATGQRVLVTSHTSRALGVLRDKIPKEIAPLCVVALSDDAKSLKALEASVGGITEKHNIWNPSLVEKEIERLHSELEVCRSDEAKALLELRIIRESETLQHISRFGSYMGSLKTIAQQIRLEESRFSWIATSVDEESEPPLNDSELIELLDIVRTITDEEENEIEKYVPELLDLPLGHEFTALVNDEKSSQIKLAALGDISAHDGVALEQCDTQTRVQLKKTLDILNRKITALSEDVYPWAKDVVQQVLAGIASPSRELHRLSILHLECIGSIIESYNVSISGIENYDRKSVRLHAAALLNHLEAGGSLGWWKLRSSVVSDALYIIEGIRVDGQLCCTVELLKKLLEWIILNENFEALQNSWVGLQSNTTTVVYSVLKAEFESKVSSLGRCLDLEIELDTAKKEISQIFGLTEPTWHNKAQIEKLIKIVTVIDARYELQEKTTNVEKILRQVQAQIDENSNIHPLAVELLNAIATRNVETYSTLLQGLGDLGSLRSNINRRRQLISILNAKAPNLVERILSDAHNSQWDSRLSNFTSAWNWARADKWIKKVSDPSNHQQFKLQVDQLRNQIQRKIAQLAAAKAWCFCLSRLSDHESGHLRAWQLAVRRIGKGTGTRVNEYRREARSHMEECRKAIPAWIMPIYRVAETMEMKPGIFDVVIVDEASQSGPEAIFLQYIAKKIVVVGDNKQISPQFVGMSKDDVALLRQRLIPDLPFNDALGIDNSFFDQAFIRYKGQICLREHFRCMPEIIQFSNNLCYSSTPLIPLKQFGANRLTPTVGTRYIQDGYQKGRSPKVTNPSEAQAIAEFLAECCKKQQYNGKTFGVISLLGEEQAKLIYSLVLEKIGPSEMERRQLICGDAYAFQGDERELIVLSMVSASGENHRIGTLTSADAEKRFNVAASRAKEQMILFHSVTLDDLNRECLRSRLLKYCLNPELEQIDVEGHDINSLRVLAHSVRRDQVRAPHPFDSWFEIDIFLEIVSRGYRVIPQFEVAGYRIDLLVEGMQGRLAVECDGDYWHGPEQYEQDMVRQRQLERGGYIFWRVRESSYYRDPQLAMMSLWDTLREWRIFSGNQEEDDMDITQREVLKNEWETQTPTNTFEEQPIDTTSIFKDEVEMAQTNNVNVQSEVVCEKSTELKINITSDDEIVINEEVVIDPDDGEVAEGNYNQCNSVIGVSTIYKNWVPYLLPDPRIASVSDVMTGIIEIVKAEEPIIGHRVYKIYVNACGIQRVGKQLRSVLNKAVSKAIREKLLYEVNEYNIQDQIHKVLRTPDCPPVLIRTRGDRVLEEIPPSEIAQVMKICIKNHPQLQNDNEKLFRAVLNNYELVRMTDNTRIVLEKALVMI